MNRRYPQPLDMNYSRRASVVTDCRARAQTRHRSSSAFMERDFRGTPLASSPRPASRYGHAIAFFTLNALDRLLTRCRIKLRMEDLPETGHYRIIRKKCLLLTL